MESMTRMTRKEMVSRRKLEKGLWDARLLSFSQSKGKAAREERVSQDRGS